MNPVGLRAGAIGVTVAVLAAPAPMWVKVGTVAIAALSQVAMQYCRRAPSYTDEFRAALAQAQREAEAGEYLALMSFFRRMDNSDYFHHGIEVTEAVCSVRSSPHENDRLVHEFIEDMRRKNVLQDVIENYYAQLPEAKLMAILQHVPPASFLYAPDSGEGLRLNLVFIKAAPEPLKIRVAETIYNRIPAAIWEQASLPPAVGTFHLALLRKDRDAVWTSMNSFPVPFLEQTWKRMLDELASHQMASSSLVDALKEENQFPERSRLEFVVRGNPVDFLRKKETGR